MTLKSSNPDEHENAGILLIEVDDILEGGNEEHRARMKKFYQKYKCGKSKRIVDLKEEGTRISGIRVKQNPDYTFTWDMNEYAKDMEKIELPRGYYAQMERE